MRFDVLDIDNRVTAHELVELMSRCGGCSSVALSYLPGAWSGAPPELPMCLSRWLLLMPPARRSAFSTRQGRADAPAADRALSPNSEGPGDALPARLPTRRTAETALVGLSGLSWVTIKSRHAVTALDSSNWTHGCEERSPGVHALWQ